MPAPSRVYVSSSPAMNNTVFGRQSANGQHNAGRGLLHCDLCSVFCMSDCVTIPERIERLLPLLAGGAVVRLHCGAERETPRCQDCSGVHTNDQLKDPGCTPGTGLQHLPMIFYDWAWIFHGLGHYFRDWSQICQ